LDIWDILSFLSRKVRREGWGGDSDGRREDGEGKCVRAFDKKKSTMNNNDNVNRKIIIELLTQDLLF
jgi:hypothetical protein